MKILGNEKLLSQIEGMLRSGRLPHACIITGPRGSGKKTLARMLASAAVCLGEMPPCGLCEGCAKAEKDIHPDIERVKRERGEITISQVRSLRASLYTRPNESPRKVAIIEEADKLNTNAQNGLLTVLEEPPSAVLLILVAENESELLPTIRSRCVHFRMEPLTEELIIQGIKKKNPLFSDAEAIKIVKKAEGSLGRALELLDTEDEGRLASEIVRAVASGNKRSVASSVLALEGLKREQISEELREVKGFLAGAAAVKYKKREYYPAEEDKLLAEHLSIKQILRLSMECDKLSQYCESNVGTGHISGALISILSEGLI